MLRVFRRVLLTHYVNSSVFIQSHRSVKTSQFRSSMYEPDYLNVKPEIPSYDTLNIRLRGYDFVTLESFAKYVHKTADAFGLETRAFPVPAKTSKVHTYKPQSTHVLHEYELAKYERTVQVDNLTSTMAPIFIEILQSNMVAGVEMTIKTPEDDEEEFRFVPDLTLQELKMQQQDLEKAREERKKK